jgi:hypothetical protein
MVIRLVGSVSWVVLSVLVAGCGSAKRETTAGGSTCAYAYILHIGSTEVESSSCAGLIPPHPLKVSVRLGEKFSVEVLHEENGSLDLPVLSPVGRAVTQVQRQGASIVYVGRSLGTSRLVARHTGACLAKATDSSCVAFTVSVISS